MTASSEDAVGVPIRTCFTPDAACVADLACRGANRLSQPVTGASPATLSKSLRFMTSYAPRHSFAEPAFGHRPVARRNQETIANQCHWEWHLSASSDIFERVSGRCGDFGIYFSGWPPRLPAGSLDAA